MEQEIYTCAICGKNHEKLDNRMTCESNCLKAYNREKERKKMEEARKQKLTSEKVIEAEVAKVNNMIKAHYHEYGDLNLVGPYPYLKHVLGNCSIWCF